MKSVFILQHVNELPKKEEDVKFIGAYSKKEEAQKAINRLSKQPGFKDSVEGFCIDEYEIDKDNWCEGFVTVF